MAGSKTIGWCAVILGVTLLASSAAAETRSSTLAAGRQALEVDGAFAGYVVSTEGGHMRGQVTTVRRSATVVDKRIANPTVVPLVVELQLPLEAPLLEWVSKSMAGEARAGSVRLTTYDAGARAVASRELQGALLTAVTLDPLDGSSRSPLRLTLEISASKVVDTQPSGAAPAGSPKSTKALASNYRLSLGSLPTNRVAKISGVSWRRPLATSTGSRRTEPAPGAAEVGDLTVRVSAADAKAWSDWARRAILEGRSEEQTGKLELLARDLKSVVMSIGLSHVGIFELAVSGGGAADALPYLDASLYVEGMTFSR